MRILVFGAGSLGTLVGGLLASVHDVTLVARDRHATRVSKTGLDIVGAESAHASPAATTAETGHDADLAIVTVKSFDTAAAAEALADCDADAILSLQNGLTEEMLASRLEAPVLAGTATYGARLVAPGRVECTGVGRVVLGALDGGTSPLAERVGKAFRDANINTLVAADMPRRRWEKLAVNAGINAVTALSRVENGCLAANEASELTHRAARETARVARLEGVRLPNRVARAAIDRVIEKTAANRSSMLQDVESGKRTEVDAINGAVVDIAAEHDFEVPTNRTLAALLRAWERGEGLR
ncbi:ketopantoate reductase family protein [Haloferax mediterranei ATCC 33500]|uniref:2-dehydropantoate 2-reductase n=1 Tax=Haloferax mediterranei (strain ATCC 33500 / DSM 1411 / JCM 8866 / NBRC 14739 / NCIMB 2177 / R-4) TaxID=523841 RepID=I3R0Q9_HALMT|nr:ketopantoate reductase family protein [Haloferax mediterranei]AFK17819.1 2-dehydropantoate 2-reductase [Haloferax mediterranei ATCC 33500]AHZ22755.1 2-dehydropantoate 2-reductase [Haloferax mediterranei ATCC 33500]EMA02909.1 2-dehydropantoate 2-reductase [Haloferax mediterranei ATCC 33500]MDX5987907.1 ketopantoate reductase family protein [Haloferax mediterranei ATCC 33500]QCQ74380.1 ketopantoate reductase family protein [Haloferax mediterranei ATCC 33500]